MRDRQPMQVYFTPQSYAFNQQANVRWKAF